MKKIFVFVLTAMLFSTGINAQQMQPLPNDPAVKVGKLENGMTYYIRHNDKPENRAEFYLATNVGAIQETPDQDGLAHFLEHMCFNGTKNFPGKNLLTYLESIGASFGGNVNASTGVEQTQYMLNNIPIVRETVIDSCLLVMHDYSHFVLNDPEEIDKERGVIIEERRSRRTASWRLHEQSLPYYYGDSKYATCTLIGSQTNLETFKPESLVNFYETWYRPDMQALIVVGDVDVDMVEAKIKTIFADIPAAENPKEKDVIIIPDNEEPIVGILKDPENSSTTIEVLWKSAPLPEEFNNTAQGYMIELATSMVSHIMAERFAGIITKANAPFINADFAIGSLCETLEVGMGTVVAHENEAMTAFKAFLIEIEKMKRFGFSDSEIERVKLEIESSYEAAANRADSRKNSEFVPALINNFFDNYSYMDPATELQVVKALLAQLNSQILNTLAKDIITEHNIVVVYKGIDKEGMIHPTEEDIKAAIKEIASSTIEAPVHEELASELLDASKLKGSKVKSQKSSIYGSTEWTLKNGVKVVLYPTQYEKDRISFTLYKEGGLSLMPLEDVYSFEDNIYQLYTSNNGVSSFDAVTLSKMLSGKQASVSASINPISTSIDGVSTVKDFETALQLMYLYHTDPRFDQDAFDQAVRTMASILPNYLSQPDAKLQEAITNTVYNNHPRKINPSMENLAKADLKTIERVTRELFKDAAGSTMIVVGDFDPETIKPLIEKYAGSLPKGKSAPKWVDNKEYISTKTIVNDFKADMQTPKSTVVQVYRTDVPYTIERSVAYSAMNYILDMIYVETLREEEGGTYGASASASLMRRPQELGILEVAFETNPSSTDKLLNLAVEGVKGLAENGPTAEQFDKALKNLEKNIPEKKIMNSYWMSAIKVWYDYKNDYITEYEAAVSSLTADKVKAAAAELLKGNRIDVIMRPGVTVEAE